MWTLNWILYEPIWKRCWFGFPANIDEPERWWQHVLWCSVSVRFSLSVYSIVSIVTSRSVQAPVYLGPVRFVAPDSTTIRTDLLLRVLLQHSRDSIFVGRFLSVRPSPMVGGSCAELCLLVCFMVKAVILNQLLRVARHSLWSVAESLALLPRPQSQVWCWR